ncbi:MAG: two pore domain potassium channel family protein [Bacteroidetes bacterium]|nr:MAG: two pore domain potassium channel family protein [Bacteroidota bacterium]
MITRQLVHLRLLVGILSGILWTSLNVQAQEEEPVLPVYSYSELFQAIKSCPDTVFRLENALLRFNPQTDQEFSLGTDEMKLAMTDTLIGPKRVWMSINKHLVFTNVNEEVSFLEFRKPNARIGAFRGIHFKKSVRIENSEIVAFSDCVFDEKITFFKNKYTEEEKKKGFVLMLYYNRFKAGCLTQFWVAKEDLKGGAKVITIRNNEIHGGDPNVETLIEDFAGFLSMVDMAKNTIRATCWYALSARGSSIVIRDNRFFVPYMSYNISPEDDATEVIILDNFHSNWVTLRARNLNSRCQIDWRQFENKTISDAGFSAFRLLKQEEAVRQGLSHLMIGDVGTLTMEYTKQFRFRDLWAYNSERADLGAMLDYYKSHYDKANANMVYVELKDLETKRYEVLYHENPGFNNFFRWRINQFLKYFSEYGTNPARSILFSLYIIVCFALFYLFFPNSWDEQGRHRVINRYRFFLRYMSESSSIHELYLEKRKEELKAYESFQELVAKTRSGVPRFFTATAGLLYRWAISRTSLSLRLLRRLNFLRGTWDKLSGWKKFWKSSLLIFLFILAFIYDLFVKLLNALMLSLNTFSTLGFGEIPIRGLPRYMAIVQGFIGWFLLTIFSVSLISQLIE